MIGKRYAEKMLELLDKKKEIDFDTSETYFPLKPEAFNPSLYLEGQFASVGAAKYYTGKEKYNDETCKPVVKIFDTDDYLNPCFSVAIPASEKKVVISLDEMKTEEGKKVDPSHIYMVGFTTDTSSSLYIENVFLSDDGETPATGVESLQAPQADAKVIYYDLTGKVVENPTNGIFIRSTDHKKVLMK